MRRRLRGSRGAERRWGPHIAYLNKAKVKQKWSGTRPTVYGIETFVPVLRKAQHMCWLQQCLLFTVLKRVIFTHPYFCFFKGCNSPYRSRYWNVLATGTTKLDPLGCNSAYRLRYWNRYSPFLKDFIVSEVVTAPTVHGIETSFYSPRRMGYHKSVATAPTVYVMRHRV